MKDYLNLYDIGYANATLSIDLESMLSYMDIHGAHGGFVTMGDHNLEYTSSGVVGEYDQIQGSDIVQDPVNISSVVGVARGEIHGSDF